MISLSLIKTACMFLSKVGTMHVHATQTCCYRNWNNIMQNKFHTVFTACVYNKCMAYRRSIYIYCITSKVGAQSEFFQVEENAMDFGFTLSKQCNVDSCINSACMYSIVSRKLHIAQYLVSRTVIWGRGLY